MGRARMRVGVVGASGFAGAELVRILSGHPCFQLVRATSGSESGTRVDRAYPALLGSCPLELVKPDVDDLASSCDLVFLAVPHTASLAMTPGLVEAGVAVVDLSADYRLCDPAVYERWYGARHTSPDLLARAVYSIPELDRDRVSALAGLPAGELRLVANPGCYPTAATLAAAPLLASGAVRADVPVIVDAASGVSGAGRLATACTHFCRADESFSAYGVGAHRHLPEIEQNMSRAAAGPVGAVFTPHLAPMRRGILATVYLQLDCDTDAAQLQALYCDAYADERFIHVLPQGVQPATGSVVGTENVHLGTAMASGQRTAVVTCAIDNLVRGAAGQAVQNANLLCSLPEETGLDTLTALI